VDFATVAAVLVTWILLAYGLRRRHHQLDGYVTREELADAMRQLRHDTGATTKAQIDRVARDTANAAIKADVAVHTAQRAEERSIATHAVLLAATGDETEEDPIH
jgi:hypothetical protein